MRLFLKRKSSDPARRHRVDASSARRVPQDGSDNWIFRRNRTLTGSASPRITSANESRADLKSPRMHVHDLTKLRRKVSVAFIAILAVCMILWLVLLNFTATVSVSALQGSITLQRDRYEQAVQSYFGQHPLERLRPLLNDGRFNDFITHQLPEVVSIHAANGSELGVGAFSISLRQPIASWLIGSTQYYVDASGVAFRINYFAPPAVKIVDQSGVQQTGGTEVVSTQFLGFVGEAVAVAKTEGMTVQQVVIPPQTIRQVELYVVGHPYPIKLSLDRPVGEQVEDIRHAIAYLASKNIVPQYLDVRVSGKAFYK